MSHSSLLLTHFLSFLLSRFSFNEYIIVIIIVGLVVNMSELLIMRSRVLSPALPQILNVD